MDKVRELESKHVVQTYQPHADCAGARQGCARVSTPRAASISTCWPASASAHSATATRGSPDAIAEQSREMIHCSNLFFHPLQGQVAERLAKLSGLSRAFFCNSGAEAVEACLKFARRYWHTKGVLDRTENHRDGRGLPRQDDGRAVDDVGRALSDAVRAAAAERAVRPGELPRRFARR